MTAPTDALAFLSGGGEMGALIRSMDWSRTSLGPPVEWPQSLRTTLGLCLASNFPLCFTWGPDRIQFYNDAYRPICADKHPRSLGQDFKDCWSSAWPVIGSEFERCMVAGETTYITNNRVFLDRNGYLEEVFVSYSFSPIRDESGAVAGAFHPVMEVTDEVLAERRLHAVRALAEATAAAASVDQALRLITASLASEDLDLPFVLLYRTDANATDALLAGTTGLARGSPLAPEAISLATGGPWQLNALPGDGQLVEMNDLAGRFGAFACGPYDEPPRAAMACSISVAAGEPATVFPVAGVSARRALDPALRAFYAALQGAVATAVSRANAHELTQRRAEALAELDRAKTDFFSNVSHEFRTPLTLMLGPLERILGEAGQAMAPEAREQLEIVHRNGRRMEKLVNNLLNFSRAEAGRAQALFQPLELGLLTGELCSLFRSTIEHAGIVYVVECEALSQLPYVDRAMWESIVLNLVSNAFKFTLQGEIAVRLRAQGGRVRLEVRDTGCGIPPDALARVFERFHRVRGAVGRSIEGSGIGLALVHDLVALHGGSISAASTPGEGAAFTVLIPFGSAHLPAEQIGQDGAAGPEASSALAHLEEMRSWGVEADNAGRQHTGASQRPHILLVDDNADMRAYVAGLLQGAYEVRTAADGEEALAEVRRSLPDLVLTDVMMPRLDGFGLLRALRGHSATAGLPVILLSARAGTEASVEGLNAGADDYLVKPFSPQELRARVRTHLDLAHLRRDAAQSQEQAHGAREIALQARVFDAALSNTPDFVYTFDLSGRFTYINRALLQLWGKSAEECVGKNFFELDYPPALARQLQDQIAQVIATQAPVRDETPYTATPSGDTRDYEYIFVPVVAADGAVVAVAGSTRDITERRHALELLRENDRRKDEFLAMLAHELRNPLAAVDSAVAVLKLSSRPESMDMATDIIERQVKQFARLIDDLLDVSRITNGKIRLQSERIDAAAVLAQSVESVRPLLAQRRHLLTLDIERQALPVVADATRLQQVFVNLLANAAKYTPAGGTIGLSARLTGSELVVVVKDNGIGMAPDKIGAMFELFAQGERGIDRSEGGLGIGLTIVRRLVELHGGNVEGTSAGPGTGSSFTVRLPVAAMATATAAPAGVPQLAAGTGPGAGAGASVLVVDDNVDAAAGLALAMRLLGHRVQVAHDGEAALRQAAVVRPDVVLLDIGLPGLDGYQVAIALRAGAAEGALIVAVSGYGQDEDRRKSAAAGFDHHFVKPVALAALVALIEAQALLH